MSRSACNDIVFALYLSAELYKICLCGIPCSAMSK